MAPKGALHELETKYRALMLEAHELKREVRKLLKESTASNGKRNARTSFLPKTPLKNATWHQAYLHPQRHPMRVLSATYTFAEATSPAPQSIIGVVE
jgi:hypothetical protein